MLLQKGSREDAIHALINTWLKDPAHRCGWCQEEYKPELFPCCEKPYIANNAAIFKQFIKEKQLSADTRANDTATNKDKSMRWALSFPPGLLKYLTLAFKTLYNEELFTEQHNVEWFARKFRKYFTIPRKV